MNISDISVVDMSDDDNNIVEINLVIVSMDDDYINIILV